MIVHGFFVDFMWFFKGLVTRGKNRKGNGSLANKFLTNLTKDTCQHTKKWFYNMKKRDKGVFLEVYH